MTVWKTSLACTLTGIIGIATPAAHGQLHEGDVILFRDLPDGNRVRTGGASGLTPFAARVFEARFADTGFANRTTNPGFNAVPDQFFASAVTGVTMTRSLRKWSGGNLCTIPPERITLTKLGLTATSPLVDPASAMSGPSVTLGISDAQDGAFHEHGAFALTAPSSAGIYVLELAAWTGSPAGLSPAPSEPFWVVFNQNSTAQEQANCVAYLLSRGAGTPGSSVSLCPCAADFDQSGEVTVQDIFGFLNAWFAGLPSADVDGGGLDVQDIFTFLNTWFAGCP